MASNSLKPAAMVEAKVTSKGQVTLPRELRKRLGVERGSRIRFSIPVSGAVHVEPVLYDFEDLWRIADQGGPSKGIMSFEEMDAAKARRKW
jgi:AbrB family looped-hinge helix DNA binding protein